MSLVSFSTICLLAIIYFVVMPKNLSALELIMILIFIINICSNSMDLVILNYKRITVSNQPSEIFSFYIISILLFPLILTWSLDRTNCYPSFRGKLIILAVTFLLLFGLEYLSIYLKVIKYESWKWLWSLIRWLSIWFFGYIVMISFRKLMLKELRQ